MHKRIVCKSDPVRVQSQVLFVVITDQWCTVCLLTAPSHTTQDDEVIGCSSSPLLRDSFSSWNGCERWEASPLSSHPLWVCRGLMHAWVLSFFSPLECFVWFPTFLCCVETIERSTRTDSGLLLCISERHSAVVYTASPTICPQTIDQFKKHSRKQSALFKFGKPPPKEVPRS